MRNSIEESLRRVQKINSLINIPYLKNTELLSRIQSQIDLNQKIQLMNHPIFESIRLQNQIMNNINHPYHTFVRMAHIHNDHFAIPDTVQLQINLLINKMYSNLVIEGNDDLIGSINIRKTEETAVYKFNWNQLFQILFILYQILYPIYSDVTNNLQDERQHQEIIQQNERHHKQTLLQDQEQHEELLKQNERHHEEEMEAFNKLIELIVPYLPDDQDTTESESEDPVTPD